MTRVLPPALLVIVTVAVFIAVAGWNQSGEPQVVLVLTERELPLVYQNAAPGDDPGARLRIAYESRHDPLDARNWLPHSRLREIGFPFNVPVGSPQAGDAYDRVPPRLAWVVFEYEGPEWRDIERRRALVESPRMPAAAMRSRLVPVDVGLDVDALLRRYPDGHLIQRGVIGVSYVSAEAGGPMLHGVLRDVVPSALAVPYAFRPLVAGLTPDDGRGRVEPRYEAELVLGALGLPYIRSLRLTEGTKN
ncbi:MAG TPA: DUF4824 family protein [Vicinamibacterales bacterium]|nr:DUF4824 family protein [Vicinamibacterales bacterium]